MKPIVIDPEATARAEAYKLWMSAPNPMVTLFKTLDVTPLLRFGRRRGYKFNMLLCWCIGKAASEAGEFYLLPVGRELWKYDSIAVNTIVKNRTGEVSSCDVPFSTDLARFNADYLRLTRKTAESCENHGHRHIRRCGYRNRRRLGHEQRHFQQSVYHLGQMANIVRGFSERR